MKQLLAILFCTACIVGTGYCVPEPEVAAPVGRIRGAIQYSRLGRKIYSFRGVRYAEPPTGERRFQVPTPISRVNGVFVATQESPACPSFADPTTEDCLTLNVYTTKLPTRHNNVQRPVMVFIHPGGFYSYSSQSLYFGPQILMDKDIVLVTINFRLGSLGFISTGDSVMPGNLGLKDQVVALRWVQRNIAAFGGNPNSVTLTGYSAGGLSTMLHMVSPMSKDLFHRVIVMSGSLLTAEPFPTEQRDLATKQAELLNCTTESSEAMLACLKTKPTENFTNTMSELFGWHGDPIMNWKPVVEPKVPGQEQFLPDQPVNLIRQGKFYQVPAIFGVTKDEFGGVVIVFEEKAGTSDDYYKDMDANWTRIAPISFMYNPNSSRTEEITTSLRRFYFGDRPIDSANRDGLAHLYADSVIKFPMYRGAKLIAENSKEPVFFYEFTFQGNRSMAMWNKTTPYGVVHHDDLQYLFHPFFHFEMPEIPMIKLYTTLWTNFMRFDNPIPNRGVYKQVQWEKFSASNNLYLDINLKPKMKSDLHSYRMKEWERLFPLPPLPQT